MTRPPLAAALPLLLSMACAAPSEESRSLAPLSPEPPPAGAPPPPAPPPPPPSPTPSPAATAPGAEHPKRPSCSKSVSPEECGHWAPAPLDRWHDAMTAYAPAVTLARQQPLGAAIPAFAHYFNDVHNHVHPWFADRFLESLDRLPTGDPANEPRLATKLEIAIAPDGRIAQMGVVTSSGLPTFDAAALESFARAAPFAPTPDAIRSADGNVWMHWELRRDEVFACTTMNARPFRLGP